MQRRDEYFEVRQRYPSSSSALHVVDSDSSQPCYGKESVVGAVLRDILTLDDEDGISRPQQHQQLVSDVIDCSHQYYDQSATVASRVCDLRRRYDSSDDQTVWNEFRTTRDVSSGTVYYVDSRVSPALWTDNRWTPTFSLNTTNAYDCHPHAEETISKRRATPIGHSTRSYCQGWCSDERSLTAPLPSTPKITSFVPSAIINARHQLSSSPLQPLAQGSEAVQQTSYIPTTSVSSLPMPDVVREAFVDASPTSAAESTICQPTLSVTCDESQSSVTMCSQAERRRRRQQNFEQSTTSLHQNQQCAAASLRQVDRCKKETHNIIERNRRYTINDKINQLASLLPVKNLRFNKGAILKASVEYIKQLQEDNRRLLMAEDQYARLRHINSALTRRLKEVELRLSTKQPLNAYNDDGVMPTQQSPLRHHQRTLHSRHQQPHECTATCGQRNSTRTEADLTSDILNTNPSPHPNSNSGDSF